jgi:hypothetical protein
VKAELAQVLEQRALVTSKDYPKYVCTRRLDVGGCEIVDVLIGSDGNRACDARAGGERGCAKQTWVLCKKTQQRAAPQRQIWQIANEVRGAVDGWKAWVRMSCVRNACVELVRCADRFARSDPLPVGFGFRQDRRNLRRCAWPFLIRADEPRCS